MHAFGARFWKAWVKMASGLGLLDPLQLTWRALWSSIQPVSVSHRVLRIGIVTEGLREHTVNGRVEIANGGVGVYIYNLVKHLQQVDHNNEYWLIKPGRGELDIYRSRPGHNVFLSRSALRPLLTPIDLAYRRAAARLRLDLMHFPNQFGGGFLPSAVRRVVTLHDITPILFPQFHPIYRVVAYRLLMRYSLRAANQVIVDSAYTRGDLIGRGVVAANKVTAIPLAPAPIFRPGVGSPDFCRRYDLPDRFILTVGVLEPRKNHKSLFEALLRIHQAGHAVGLVAVGRPGWQWNDPLGEQRYRHLRPFVRIFHSVPDSDLAEFYSRATVFAYPSFYEGFGLPIVEAMACGAPVVSSDASSLPEVAGDAALFADPKDPEQLAAQLLRVLRDPALRKEMAAKSVWRAQQFSWRLCAEQTLAVYESVCEANGCG